MYKFIFLLPSLLFANTEFYLSTFRAPYYNDCSAEKDTFPVRYEIAQNITIHANLWNSDSASWCTKEGRYRGQVSGTVLWEIDGNSPSTGNQELILPILDTIEHTVTATYLQFPKATFRYKANKKLPFSPYSGYRKIFGSDSVHMLIESDFSSVIDETNPIPTITDDTTGIFDIFNNSENFAIITFNSPSDTSIKLLSFYCNNKKLFAQPNVPKPVTYNTALNTYSILIPLRRVYILAKSKVGFPYPPTIDTITAIFTKQTSCDSVQLQCIQQEYTSSINSYHCTYKAPRDEASGKIEIYDLRGRKITKTQSETSQYINRSKVSHGLYLMKTATVKRPTTHIMLY